MTTKLAKVAISLFLGVLLSSSLQARVPITIIKPYSIEQYNQELTQDIQQLQNTSDQTKREIKASGLFLNKPYVLFPNGEGIKATYDKGPVYRTDEFDCLTYVSTVIALTKATDLSSFIELMKKLNYKDAKVSFINRNHFTSADFNKNNQQAGMLTDITQQIKLRNGKSAAEVENTTINKPRWLRSLSAKRIKLFRYPGDQEAKQLLNTLRNLSSKTEVEKVDLPYIPIDSLFSPSGEANLSLFKQIPPGAIIEIVRPQAKIKITHLGLAIPSTRGMQFREASSIYNKVTDVSLIAYLRSYRSNRVVYGINIEVINRNAG